MKHRSVAILALCTQLLWIVPARAQHGEAHGDVWRAVFGRDAPTVLVAKPRVQHRAYRETVLLVASIGADRHVGVIVNRRTAVPLSRLFPDSAACRDVRDPVYLGGPMHDTTLVAVIRGEPLAAGVSVPIGNAGSALHLTIEGAIIDDVLEKRPNDARYFLGMVLWRAGELREELRQGFWSIADVAPDALLRAPTDRLWKDLSEKPGTVLAEAGG